MWGWSKRPFVPRPRRPNFSASVRALIRDAAAKLPELAHVRASRIVVVAGEARRASRATIRPLGSKRTGGAARRRPRLAIRGRRILYVITLRPTFFRRSTAETRVETLLHELFHISGRFDGRLHAGRRHAMLPGKRFGALLRPLLRRYLESAEPAVLVPFGFNGEVSVLQWLEKPPIRLAARGPARKVYTEEQLFLGPVEMITR